MTADRVLLTGDYHWTAPRGDHSGERPEPACAVGVPRAEPRSPEDVSKHIGADLVGPVQVCRAATRTT